MTGDNQQLLREKEITIANHIRQAAFDGCQCEPCTACRDAARQASQPQASGEPIIHCRSCGGTLMWEKTADGFEVIHSCHAGKQVREMVDAAFQRGARAMAEKAARHPPQLNGFGSVVACVGCDWKPKPPLVEAYSQWQQHIRSLAGASAGTETPSTSSLASQPKTEDKDA
jgi:hypothetical protein